MNWNWSVKSAGLCLVMVVVISLSGCGGQGNQGQAGNGGTGSDLQEPGEKIEDLMDSYKNALELTEKERAAAKKSRDRWADLVASGAEQSVLEEQRQVTKFHEENAEQFENVAASLLFKIRQKDVKN